MLPSAFWSTSRLRFIRKHLLMLLVAFGWLFVNSQLAVASHDCQIDVTSEAVSVQHSQHMQMADHGAKLKTSGALCDKHCLPDVMQKDNGHSELVAIPVADSLALVVPECAPPLAPVATLTPPATGPPATIRFCRFRE